MTRPLPQGVSGVPESDRLEDALMNWRDRLDRRLDLPLPSYHNLFLRHKAVVDTFIEEVGR